MKLKQLRAPNWDRPDRRLQFWRREGLMFHRCTVAETVQETIDFFQEEGEKWIGSKDMPYAFVIPKDGTVYQCVGCGVKTPHARGASTKFVSAAVMTDCRKEPPTPAQTKACIWLAQRFSDHMHKVPVITVHSAIPTAYKDPNKKLGGPEECPGPHFHKTWHACRNAIMDAGKVVWFQE